MVNWDAIEQLPDQYEVVISAVEFDVKKDFPDIGNGNYMPSPALHYKIAEAKGISGGEKSLIEPIYEDVNISEMNREDTPNFQKMVVGYRCTKYSTVMEEDGTERRSSACTIDYNVWNRMLELWAKEEMYTEGYTKQGKYPPKYDTKWKRKAAFQAEVKFAMQKAETKAHEKTIRELAGLKSDYRAEDLKSGRFIFAKVRRSREILQAETAARLTAMSKGIEAPQQLLFGEPEPIPEPEPEAISVKERLISALEQYKTGGSVKDIETTNKMLAWLKSEAHPEEKTTFWKKAIDNLKAIEADIPEEFRIKHGLT